MPSIANFQVSEIPTIANIVEMVFLAVLGCYGLVTTIEPFMGNCVTRSLSTQPSVWSENSTVIMGGNPFYLGPNNVVGNCAITRSVYLLGLNPVECSYARRLFLSLFLAVIVGYERQQTREDGVRVPRSESVQTMALIAVGCCCYTICSGYGFQRSPVAWDSSRVSACIPKAIGFLGAGLVWKGANKDGGFQIKGLTSAASAWIVAAVGVAVGGELYFAAIFTTVWSLLLLRYGPQDVIDGRVAGTDSTSGYNMQRNNSNDTFQNYKSLNSNVASSEVNGIDIAISTIFSGISEGKQKSFEKYQ